MSAMEKSDLPEVARKRTNKAASAAAEPVERRGGAKENVDLQSTVRTQSREAVSQAQARIREAVTRNRQDELTALLHHINIDVLRTSFFGLKKTAAPGVDEMTRPPTPRRQTWAGLRLVGRHVYDLAPLRRGFFMREQPLGLVASGPRRIAQWR